MESREKIRKMVFAAVLTAIAIIIKKYLQVDTLILY